MSHALNCRPLASPEHVAGMSACLTGRSRRLARFGDAIRVATDVDPCGARISLGSLPPTPPHDGNPPGWGQTKQVGGQGIGFFNAGGRRVRGKPVDYPLCNLVTPRGTKQNHPTVNFENPRVVPIYPRVWSFIPRVGFCRFAPSSLSISLFSLRRERGERGRTGKLAIHGFFGCLKKHPRVCSAIHGFSGDEKTGNPQCWRGFAGCLAPIHASTGRNAYTSPTKVRNER